ncbi:MAG TPA: hypothetical protein VNP04_21495 [Alphaproteobacteria bacterium]|nr:hypothetical protein [Alphaproteobacteria bacterium]
MARRSPPKTGSEFVFEYPPISQDAAAIEARQHLIRRTLLRTFRPHPAYPQVRRIPRQEVLALQAKLNAAFPPELRAWRQRERLLNLQELA